MSAPLATAAAAPAACAARPHRAGSDAPFFAVMGGLGGSYVVLIVALMAANVVFMLTSKPHDGKAEKQEPDLVQRDNKTKQVGHVRRALSKPEIQYAIRLTLITCTISALLSTWVATPLGYLLSRFTFRGRWLIDTIIDIPVVLPPLVIGLSLLILFHLPIAGSPAASIALTIAGSWLPRTACQRASHPSSSFDSTA